jgi:hypothetical protein
MESRRESQSPARIFPPLHYPAVLSRPLESELNRYFLGFSQVCRLTTLSSGWDCFWIASRVGLDRFNSTESSNGESKNDFDPSLQTGFGP